MDNNLLKTEKRLNIPEETRLKYLAEEKKMRDDIYEQIKMGGSEMFNATFTPLDLKKMPFPVHMPSWLFREYKHHPFLKFTDIEKVALTLVIHFTAPDTPSGYIECSGHIENWCKCSVEEAHNTLKSLEERGFITSHVLQPEMCLFHSRNLGYFANVVYLNEILSCYDMNIWA